MSFRGGGRGGARGGGFSRGGGRGGGGFGGGGFNRGPPQNVVPVATYNATVEGLMCCSVVEKKVPLLMRSIYMENKTLIGKVDDVFGPITAPGIAIKPSDGVKGEGF
jgi:H/ACA ribonucleoprotein complex subunit 1